MKMCSALDQLTECNVHLFGYCDNIAFSNTDDVFRVYDTPPFKITLYKKNNSFVRIPRFLEYSFKVYRAIKTDNPDVLISRSNLAFLIPFLFTSKPFIFEQHIFAGRLPIIERLIFNRYVKSNRLIALICITKTSLMEYLTNTFYATIASKIHVLPDGADSLSNKSKVARLKGNHNFNIGYTGSMNPGKGIDKLLMISKQLNDIGFHIVGGSQQRIEYYTSKYGCPSNVHFYGYVHHQEVGNFIEAFDVCILPNDRNSWGMGAKQNSNKSSNNIGNYTSPLKLFEYMSHGKPIIASDLKVLREVLNEKNSVLIDPDKIQDWIVTIRDIQDDHTFLSQIGKQAYIDFETKYSWETRSHKFLELIKSYKNNKRNRNI
jgi:glycosyltransferase involved in cell wall biosynthesis